MKLLPCICLIAISTASCAPIATTIAIQEYAKTAKNYVGNYTPLNDGFVYRIERPRGEFQMLKEEDRRKKALSDIKDYNDLLGICINGFEITKEATHLKRTALTFEGHDTIESFYLGKCVSK